MKNPGKNQEQKEVSLTTRALEKLFCQLNREATDLLKDRTHLQDVLNQKTLRLAELYPELQKLQALLENQPDYIKPQPIAETKEAPSKILEGAPAGFVRGGTSNKAGFTKNRVFDG